MGNLYTSTTFMEHNSHPDYKYEMDAPTHEHDGINPSCGDELTLQLRVENNVIEEASFTGHGCAISQASADIMADLITGETVEEARRLAGLFLAMIRGEQLSEEDLEDLDEAAQLQDISHMPARVKCAELAWRTLEKLLDQILPKRPLREYGVTREDLPVFAHSVVTEQGRLMANNFVPLDEARVLKIYQELF